MFTEKLKGYKILSFYSMKKTMLIKLNRIQFKKLFPQKSFFEEIEREKRERSFINFTTTKSINKIATTGIGINQVLT